MALTAPRRILTGLLLLPFLAAPQYAVAKARAKAAPAAEILTVYSDICAKSPAGDLLGLRILLLDSGTETYALLQSAQGEMMRPETGEASINGNKLRLEIYPGREARFSFTGKITKEMITGSFSDGRLDRKKSKIFHFKRQPNKLMPAPACK